MTQVSVATLIGEYLEQFPLYFGYVGTQLFTGMLPSTPDVASVIAQTPGRPPTVVVDVEFIGVTIRTRSTTYADAESRANLIMDKLHGLTAEAVTSGTIQRIDAQGSPYFAGRDEHDRVLFAIPFIVTRDITA